jgi:hypothetical protein
LKKVSVLILVCLVAVGVLMASGCTTMQNNTTNITKKAEEVNQTAQEKINNTTSAATNAAKDIQNKANNL